MHTKCRLTRRVSAAKMAELRALVAVKRVIDFAVKVTGTPTPTSVPAPRDPHPCASGIRGAQLWRSFEKSPNF